MMELEDTTIGSDPNPYTSTQDGVKQVWTPDHEVAVHSSRAVDVHARKQIETLSEQIKELTSLEQKMTDESARPIALSVNQAFKKAS